MANMIPEETKDYAGQLGCLAQDSADEAVKTQCAKLSRDLEALEKTCTSTMAPPSEERWRRFKASFDYPCKPIPQEFLDASNPHFYELMQLIAPEIIFHPEDQNPPVSMQSIVDDLKSAGSSERTEASIREFPFSDQLDEKLREPQKANCATRDAQGECCGEVSSPLYFDFFRKGDVITATFVTAHRYGAVLDLKLPSVRAGAHVFDSESVRYLFKSRPDGTATLEAGLFSRHGLRVQTTPLCAAGKYRSEGKTSGSHPVFYQVRGGHSLYVSAKTPDNEFTPMYTRSKLEKEVEEESHIVSEFERSGQFSTQSSTTAQAQVMGAFNPISLPVGLVLGDRTVASLESRHESGGCVSKLASSSLQGIGSLWNDRNFGANAKGDLAPQTPESDLCVAYQSDAKRSLRNLAQWMDLDPESFKKFECR